jgi:hypothetical protein
MGETRMLRVVKYFHSRGRMIRSAALLLAAAAAIAQAAPASEHRPQYLYMRGVNSTAAPSNPQNMEYHGGAVFASSKTYAIWWGEPSDFSRDDRDGIDDILQDGFEGSVYLAIVNQYLFGKKAHTRFGGNFFDHSAPPTQDPPTTEIVAEVYKVLSNYGVTPDPTAIYSVYTSNFPNQNYYCAFHDYGTSPDGTLIHVIYVPNIRGSAVAIAGCAVAPPDLSCNSHSVATQAAANSTAHELLESITDPNNDAWWNVEFNNEIGDPCNFTYKRCVNLSNGTKWQLQEIWSNKAGACRQGSGVADD